MSELKYQLMLNKDMSWVPCYLKSEADKVIAEKDAEIEKLDDCIRDYSENTKTLVIANLDMQRREDRHKYKRCLAMARWCRTSARCDEGLGAFKYRDWYWKWFKRWFAIAEQFKEAK